MSYDYSFEKSQLWLLGTLTVLMAVLLIATGFLIGRITVTPSDTVVAGGAGAIAGSGAVVSSERPAGFGVASGEKGSTGTVVQAKAGPVASPTTVVVPLEPAPAATPVATSGGVDGGADASTLRSRGYTLQYGAFRDPSNARQLLKQLAEQKVIGSSVTMTNGSGVAYAVVRSGAYRTMGDARHAAVEQATKLRMPIEVRPAGRL